MPQIVIDFNDEENKNIEIFKAKEGLKNKEKTVRLIIRKFFKMKEPAKREGWKK